MYLHLHNIVCILKYEDIWQYTIRVSEVKKEELQINQIQSANLCHFLKKKKKKMRKWRQRISAFTGFEFFFSISHFLVRVG